MLLVTRDIIVAGIRNKLGAIDTLESAREFMTSNNFVKDVIVHMHSSDNLEDFETLIQILLSKPP